MMFGASDALFCESLLKENSDPDQIGHFRRVQIGEMSVQARCRKGIAAALIMLELRRRPLRITIRRTLDRSSRVFGMLPATMTNVVDVYINYLRRKVDTGYDQPLIRTIESLVIKLAETAPLLS